MTLSLILVLAAVTYAPPGPLQVEAKGAEALARADAFVLRWDLRRGGGLVGLTVRDWAGEHQVAAGVLGDVVFRTDAGTFRLSAGRAEGWQVSQAGPGIVRLRVSSPVVLRDGDGKAGPVAAEQSFTIFAEGAVFCDLTLRAWPGADNVGVGSCALELPCSVTGLSPVGFYAKKAGRKAGTLEQLPVWQAVRPEEPVSHAGFFYGRGKGYCAGVEFVLENQATLTGRGTPKFEITPATDGRKTFRWVLHYASPVRVSETCLGKGMRLRWGACVSRLRQRSIAIGQRVAHWQEGRSGLMTFPSDSAVEAMALAGVTVNVLHLYWSMAWGRQHVPVDRGQMRRWVRACKRHGIRPVLYVVPVDKPGIDGINKSWYDDYGVEGLYFDFGAVSFNLARYPADYPAMDYLKLTRHYRDVVGPDGLMISHCSAPFPDLVFLRNIDAYLPGEARHHGRMLKSWLDASWHGGQAAAVSHPWCEYRPWQTKHATAIFASIGAFPHVLFGRGTHEDNNYHRCIIIPAGFVLPYWQMLRTIPMDGQTVMYNEATRQVARSSAPDVHRVVYARGRDARLVIVSNLGKPADVVVRLDERALGLAGEWRVWRLFDDVTRPVKEVRWEGPTLRCGHMLTDEYTGFVLVRRGSAAEREVRRRLEGIAELRRQLTNERPPGPVKRLRARPAAGMVALSWQRPHAAAHVCEYRIWRSDRGEAPIAAAEECERYLDFTAPPGRRVRYEVRPVDIAGNEGPAIDLEVSVPRGELVCADFDRGLAPVEPLKDRWQVRGGWAVGGRPIPVASPKGDTFAFAPVQARYIRLYFRGGHKIHNNAHVIEARVYGQDAKELVVEGVTSSGDDPGHPASDVIDGIVDQRRNGWWSDRRKGVPAWVCLDLGESRLVGRVWVLTFADGERWYDYAVQVSADGKRWQTVGESARRSMLAVALGPEVPQEVTLSVVIRQIGKRRVSGGLLFAANDEGDGYALVLDDAWDGRLVLGRLEGGGFKQLRAIQFGHSIYRPLPHLLQVRLGEGGATCYCDGVRAFDAELSDRPGRRVGLVCKGGRLLFENLQAWRGLPGNAGESVRDDDSSAR